MIDFTATVSRISTRVGTLCRENRDVRQRCPSNAVWILERNAAELRGLLRQLSKALKAQNSERFSLIKGGQV